MIKISIGIAIYNINPIYVKDCLNSIIPQLTKETELIIIDDCSSIDYSQIKRTYCTSDNIYYIKNNTNIGISNVRNQMINTAKGKWIYFIDGDDFVSKDFVKLALKFSELDTDILFYQYIPYKGNIVDNPIVISPKKLDKKVSEKFGLSCITSAPPELDKYGIHQASISFVTGRGYRLDFLLQNNISFIPNQKKAQDVLFNSKAYKLVANIIYIPAVIYYYRLNEGSICVKYNADFFNIADSYFKHITEYIEQYYSDIKDIEFMVNYKVLVVLIEALKLNIFHKNNPKSKKERFKDFETLIKKEPYKSFLENFDLFIKQYNYSWNERILIINLVKKNKFNTLDFMFKHPLTFKFYGKLKNTFFI